MKSLLAGVLVLFAAASYGQRPLPLSLANLANSIQPPPTDVTEAWKMTIDVQGQRKIAPRIEAENDALLQRTTEIARARPSASTSNQRSEELNTAMQEFEQETARAGQAIGNGDLQTAAAESAKDEQHFDEAHHQIEQEEADAIAHAPASKGGEATVADPKAVRAIQEKAWERHLAVENERLAKHRTAWNGLASGIKSSVVHIDDVLAACHYAEGAPAMYQQILSGYQMLGLGKISTLYQQSTQDILRAADWNARYLAWQKANP